MGFAREKVSVPFRGFYLLNANALIDAQSEEEVSVPFRGFYLLNAARKLGVNL